MSEIPPKESWLQLEDDFWEKLPARPKKSAARHLGSCDPAGQSYFLASLARNRPGRLWILCPHARRREQLADEFSFWRQRSYLLPDPAMEIEGELSDPEREAERQQIFRAVAGASSPEAKTHPLILSRASFGSAAPKPGDLDQSLLELAIDLDFPPEDLEKWFAGKDYEAVPQVYQRQQFARRGGIIDFFPAQAMAPVRVEFFGDSIDSIREFDLESQGTTKRLEHYTIQPEQIAPGPLLSTWPQKNDLVVALDEDDHHLAQFIIDDNPRESWNANCYPSPAAGFQAGDFVIADNSRQLFIDQLQDWTEMDWTVGLIAPSDAEELRLREILGEEALKKITFQSCRGKLDRGFLIPDKKLALLSTLEIFGRQHLPQRRQSKNLDHQRAAAAQASVHELNEGELVVHADYGIGEFLGLLEGDDGREELGIEYRDGATLHVPIDQSHLVARYVGLGGRKPKLSKLGDQKWSKLRKQAESAVLDYAAQLLRVQADRETLSSNPHPPDNQWMWEFEHSFEYTETPDQKKAIIATKTDMEAEQPMDRLICGDVGFGKTEVAIRAAFKAATGGSQVAILAPTTVLAEQHARTFRERMSDFPIKVELLTRLRSAAEMRRTITGLAEGSVDIVIGTHRLLSKQVVFKKIGLLVVDEEQRFGVRHKEQLKENFRHVDVLTLSATPIPRTLYPSLMGARDMSTIDTPPPNRLPVITSVCAYDERIIRNAIRREISRSGQIFFLHNRVQTIEMMKRKIEDLVPEIKIVIGHGQMEKSDLEKVMKTFVAGEADMLLATTIIESGLDIPNANTILIDRADRFGLADLYQLRGRVGRAGRRAYAILLLPRDQISGGDSRKRLNAIKQYTELGSGFKIAMRDLEIRGAGSLLGTKQSGHIVAVGFDLYCQLLRQSIEQLKGKNTHKRADTVVKTDFLAFSEAAYDPSSDKIPAFFPHDYAPHGDLRVTAYRQLAALKTEKELKSMEANWRDRFGKPPEAVQTLLKSASLRLIAAPKNIQSVEIKNRRLMVQRNGQYLLPADGKYPRLNSRKNADLLDEAINLIRAL